MARTWFDVFIVLPDGASVEIDQDPECGHLRCQIEFHNDAERLAVLSDALRACVVELDAARADLASREAGAS